jgi:hypothetical protein
MKTTSGWTHLPASGRFAASISTTVDEAFDSAGRWLVSPRGASDTLRQDLYPDIVALGGLGAAMDEAARRRGCDIGTLMTLPEAVSVGTARGVLTVGLAVEERLFRVGVHVPGFSRPIGSTEDLGRLVEAVAAWRGGMPFEEFRARFEFMELDTFVRALESGEPTSLQWADLLSSEFHQGQWNLLRRIHADEELRRFFPTISHGAVRLRVDPFDGASRQILVREVAADRFEVVRPDAPDATWVEVPAADLIACLRAALIPWTNP